MKKKEVFITSISSFFPNTPVNNEEMEDYLGLICGQKSRVKNIVLRQNGIKTRYYALDTKQQITHTNAEMAGKAINKLFPDNSISCEFDLLACATSTPDQILPSHASMVHGYLKNKPLEIFSSAGICLTSLQALKICYLSLLTEDIDKAVCSTSELTSPCLLSKHYDKEYEYYKNVNKNPYMAFEKDFMRFMLSDGASAVLLANTPNTKGLNIKVEWIDMLSYANELPTCMFMASELTKDGELKSWKCFTPEDIIVRSVLTGKQDIRILKKYLIDYWIRYIKYILLKYNVYPSNISFVIPHVSSMFFYNLLNEELINQNIDLCCECWFTNLTKVGNVGSASIFISLEELVNSGKIRKNDKILLLVPESGRFSFGSALLSVI